MTSILKCVNCNMVLDEMLAYVQNKISIVDEDSLAEIKNIKDTYATLEHLENFRKEFQNTKFSPSAFSSSRLNIKSGRTIDSDPIDLSDSHLMQNIEDHKSSRTGFGESFQTEEQLNHFNISFAGVVAESDKSKNMSSRSVGSSDAPLNLTSLRSTDKETSEQLCVSVNKHKQAAAIATLTLQEQNENITGNEWKLVQYKSKPKNRYEYSESPTNHHKSLYERKRFPVIDKIRLNRNKATR
ncbi:unnamed protein product [Arctia plantaginis]|uniref:Uncharacterized protein n=1 Tax=Arctia plantaginis TaxID=874455 RepID=A0A8S1AW25_ARCPL|nr:unnamed protein product [Arctia plantaginis]